MSVQDRVFDVSGSRVVVTGAAGGLGFAMAEVLAECGARVTLADIDERRLTTSTEGLAGLHDSMLVPSRSAAYMVKPAARSFWSIPARSFTSTWSTSHSPPIAARTTFGL